MNDTVTIYARWIYFKSDARQFRQDSEKFVPATSPSSNTIDDMPPLYIGVDVPLTEEYIFNYRDFRTPDEIMGELGYNTDDMKERKVKPKPILTISGMRYIKSQFEARLTSEDLNIVQDADNSEFDTLDWNF